MDAGEASWNMRVISKTPPSPKFLGSTNSDLAFIGNYTIQGSYNGYQIWDISDPARPSLKDAFYCPASQSDVSVYKNLLFVSSESNTGRIDCGDKGISDPVSKERIRGVRIFDISNISSPKYLANVQTCRGSHTHTLVVDPNDRDNVYVYISGSASVRPSEEMPGCSNAAPESDPNSAHFRIEVIKVPLAHPEQAAIVASPRIFDNLAAPPTHGEAETEKAALEQARRSGAFIAKFGSQEVVLSATGVKLALDSVVKARGGSGPATHADSEAYRATIPAMVARVMGPPASWPAARSRPVPRYHGLSGDRARRRRVRWVWPAARHP